MCILACLEPVLQFAVFLYEDKLITIEYGIKQDTLQTDYICLQLDFCWHSLLVLCCGRLECSKLQGGILMVLLDHFHPPLSVRRHWHAFHNAWAIYIASALNQQLPQGYFAEPNVQYGIEIDVAAFEEGIQPEAPGAVIAFPVQQTAWQPPAPSQTLPFQPTTETVEISIFNSEAGPTLAGAIELVSPANKDRASDRHAFIAKCHTYLQQGIGLVVVDVVTSRNANLHEELIARLGTTDSQSSRPDLYAIAYRVVERAGQINLDVWQETLSLNHNLPTLPLWLHGDLCLPVDLDATYQRTCREQRISDNPA